MSSLASSLAKPTDGGLIVSDVRNLCLLLGRLGHAQITAVLAQFGAQLIPVLSELIKLPQAEVQRPALALFQRLVIQEKGQAEAEIFLEPLFEMLAEEDSAAKAVVGLLAQFIAQYPHSRLLGKVFEQLDKPLINLRLNAMALLKELITVRQDQLPVSPLLQQEVAEKLLTRLTDEELASRVGAADLFVSLPPAFVLPRLVQLLHHTDARQRAAAGASLKAVLEKGEPSRVFSEFLNLLRSPPVIQEADDPSMLGEQNELRWPADYPSRLVQLLKEFLSHTSTASRSTLTAQLLEHFWAHPSSEPLVRTLGSVVALLDVRFILSEVASRLEQLRDDQDIFVQLAPLLVLKLVPVGDWERFDSELTSLERQLPTLLSNPRPELRQVAAECFGRLARPSVLVSQWTDVLATGPPSSVRAVLFSLCQRLLLQPLSLVAEFPLLLTSTLKLVASLEQSTAEDDVKLSRGLADHLGFLLRASLVQLDQQHKSSGSKLALKQLEEGLPVQLRDCGLDNLFAFALFNLSSSSPLLLTAWASCLKACDDSQLTLVSRLLLSKLPASPKESSPFLEVAFHLSFHLSSKNLLEQDTASLLVDVV